jgi:hypothetical protein
VPGNNAGIGGLKVASASGWFAARLSAAPFAKRAWRKLPPVLAPAQSERQST